MNGQQWYYAQIRWAVMVDGNEGLRGCENSVIGISPSAEPSGKR